MKLIITLILILIAFPVFGQPQKSKKKDPRTLFERFWDNLTGKPQPKVSVAKPHKSKKKETKAEEQPSPTPVQSTPIPVPRGVIPRGKDGTYIVDAQWMANYWEQELAWGYPLPEDDDIKFKEGKYYVPPVVYRHFEDMVNTARIKETPPPTINFKYHTDFYCYSQSGTSALGERGNSPESWTWLYLCFPVVTGSD